MIQAEENYSRVHQDTADSCDVGKFVAGKFYRSVEENSVKSAMHAKLSIKKVPKAFTALLKLPKVQIECQEHNRQKNSHSGK
jgi:hypothetical protein